MALLSAPWIDIIYLFKIKKGIAAARYLELQQEEGGIHRYELKDYTQSSEI
jgi:hypothetical protein